MTTANDHEIFGHTGLVQEEDTRLLGHKVYTGFPNQANDHTLPVLDFNKYLAPNKSATFTIRVAGNSMREANLSDGDLIIVDRSKKPASGSIIVAVLNSEFAVKIFHRQGNRIFLLPKHKNTQAQVRPLEIFPDDDFQVWGVVNFIIHNAKIYDRSG
jgi:DNA polymerase V